MLNPRDAPSGYRAVENRGNFLRGWIDTARGEQRCAFWGRCHRKGPFTCVAGGRRDATHVIFEKLAEPDDGIPELP